MRIYFNIYSFFYFVIGFVAFTVLGTISHELGHIVVANRLGYGTTLHYGSMNWNKKNGWEEIKTISSEYQYEIENNLPFKKKDEYDNIVKKLNSDRFIISIGGVLQTTICGSVGFFLLLFNLKSIRKKGLKKLDWLFVFLSLFWLREVFNLIASLSSAILNNNQYYFSGDETVISKSLNLPTGTFSIILGIGGLIISTFVVFNIIPRSKRLTFILAGQIGSASGFFLWMKTIGPIVLP